MVSLLANPKRNTGKHKNKKPNNVREEWDDEEDIKGVEAL